uniref:Uncharacterized protein n=1 Tax=Magnetococcus massalia (strain MO-1) TaxID=451514 RepID=A0A1S7LJI2_MAGMO|nr:protein of unknown function [Candidatus Magnetococcus massalia]
MLVAEGDITLEDEIRGYQTVMADPAFDPSFNGLYDMRRANILGDGTSAREVARFMREEAKISGRWALIVDSPRLTALAMVYGDENRDQHHLGLFVSTEAASDYLGLEVDPLLQTIWQRRHGDAS